MNKFMNAPRLAVTSIIIAAVAYAVFVLAAGFEDVVVGFSRLSLTSWITLAGISLLHFLLRFVRWQVYLLRLGHQIAVLPSALIYLSGFALTTSPGKIGEAWRAVYLGPRGVPFSHVLAGFFAERYTDLLAIAILSCLAITLYDGPTWPFVIGSMAMIAMLLVLRLPGLPLWVDNWADRTKLSRLARSLNGLSKMLRASADLLSERATLLALVVAVVAWSLHGLILFAVVDLLGYEANVWHMIGTYALAMLIGALSLIPGGVGSADATMILMLTLAGIDASGAAVATLVCRVLTLWFAVLLGLISVGVLGLRKSMMESGTIQTNSSNE